jgi:hypothetical protein
MRRRSRATVGVLALALLATVMGLASAATRPTGSDPAVDRWARWPYRVACSQLTFDPVRAFSRPTRAERGSGSAERALRRFLGTAAAAEAPKHDWRLLAKTARLAEFGHGRLESEGGLSWLGLTRRGEGWVDSNLRRCLPRTIRHGIAATDWVLREGEPPDPAAERIAIGVHEMGCAGARDPLPHVVRPADVRYGRKAVVITVWVRPPEGPHTCPSNPVGWLGVKLPGPLGGRALFDGATYPPRRVQPGEDPRRLPR